MENPGFLKTKYNLHTSPEVESSVKRTEFRTGEKVPQNPEARIQNYLDRLENLILDPEKKQERKEFKDGSKRPRVLSLLREMVMNEYVRPNKTRLAEGAARVEERAARNLGMEVHYGEEELAQRGEIAVADLEKSLDGWISYLSDANESYPTWFRYYAFRNILSLGDFDKDKKEFSKRSPGSTRLFPEIDRGALAYVLEKISASQDPKMLEKIRQGQKLAANNDIPENELLTKEKAENFAKLSFSKQYAEGFSQAGEITPELREITEGKWVKYQKGTDPTALWASLQNKGTAWCTKGFATAETQLQGGDFYVYYTLDKQGKPTIPRIAIRMQENSIGEVRGVADGDQNLEGNMAGIAQEKLNEFPDGKAHEKKTEDMKRLTEIEKKTKENQQLTKDELIFLYEIENAIEGFGYQKDPRIEQLRKSRDLSQDVSTIFECEPNQIAKSTNEITENTKAYIGKWDIEVFQTIRNYPGITHLYESFPDKKIFMQTIETDPNINSPEKAETKIKAENIYLSDYGKDILYKTEFSKEQKSYDLVRFTDSQLGLPSGATTDQIYQKAQELGLELCPAEVGPQLLLQYSGKEHIWIAMKQITDRNGVPSVFFLVNVVDGLKLDGSIARPYWKWAGVANWFVFLSRKLET